MRRYRLYNAESVVQDVANLVYVIADVREGQYDAHSLHHTFDLCAPGNIDRAHRILDLAGAEVEALLYGGDKGMAGVKFRGGTAKRGDRIRWQLIERLVHEYLVARVLADWLAVAFPPLLASLAATSSSRNVSRTGLDSVVEQWKERSAEVWNALECAVRSMTTTVAFPRRIPPL